MLHSGEVDVSFAVTIPSQGSIGSPARCFTPRRDDKKTEFLRSQQRRSDLFFSMTSWLRDLDGGAGELLIYSDILEYEFESNLAQIACAKVEGDHDYVLHYVDPMFWETLSVKDPAHKLLFAKGFQKL